MIRKGLGIAFGLALSAAAFGQSAYSSDVVQVAANKGLSSYQASYSVAGSAVQIDYGIGAYPNVGYTFAPADWSSSDVVEVDVQNLDSDPAPMNFQVNSTTNGVVASRYGSFTVPASARATFYLPFQTYAASIGMSYPPVGADQYWMLPTGATVDRSHVTMWLLYETSPTKARRVQVYAVKPLKLAPNLNGMVDRFGQYTGLSWTNKVIYASQFASLNQTEEADLAAHPKPATLDKYGGDASGPQLTATGRFRLQNQNGKWCFVDPLGRQFLSMGMNAVNDDATSVVTGRTSYFGSLPGSTDPGWTPVINVALGPVTSGQAFNFYRSNTALKYGSGYADAAARRALQRLQSWGFNTLGFTSSTQISKLVTMPYIATVADVSGSFGTIVTDSSEPGVPLPDVFDPAWRTQARESILYYGNGAGFSPLRDPLCEGWFIDNELGWTGGSEENGRYGVYRAVSKLSASTSYAKAQLVADLRSKYVTLARLNAAWRTAFPSWSAVGMPFDNPVAGIAARQADYLAFITKFAESYFGTLQTLIKGADADALYLGCRFRQGIWTPEVLAAASRHTDAMSFNVYGASLEPNTWSFLQTYNKPCLVSEFNFTTADRGFPGVVNQTGSAQSSRAAAFTSYVNSVLANPYFVGCHWFQYLDEPISGRMFDGENYNTGFVDITDTPYSEMVTAARNVFGTMYATRSRK